MSAYPANQFQLLFEQRDERRFRLTTAIVLAVFLTAGAILSNLELPVEERETYEVVPERLVRFIQERQPPPAPQERPQERKPEEKDQAKEKEAEKVEPEKPKMTAQERAREKASKSGILALNNELADLIDTSSLNEAVTGSGATADTAAAEGGGGDGRSILTASAGSGSGGIGSANLESSLGGADLQAHSRTKVASTKAQKASRQTSGSAKSGNKSLDPRAAEQIQVVFDQNKGRIFSLYNRALRRNPGLQGKIVLEITIERSGQVSNVRVLSSELNDEDLEKKLVSRVRLFRFPASDKGPVKIKYPIEFLPS